MKSKVNICQEWSNVSQEGILDTFKKKPEVKPISK